MLPKAKELEPTEFKVASPLEINKEPISVTVEKADEEFEPEPDYPLEEPEPEPDYPKDNLDLEETIPTLAYRELPTIPLVIGPKEPVSLNQGEEVPVSELPQEEEDHYVDIDETMTYSKPIKEGKKYDSSPVMMERLYKSSSLNPPQTRSIYEYESENYSEFDRVDQDGYNIPRARPYHTTEAPNTLHTPSPRISHTPSPTYRGTHPESTPTYRRDIPIYVERRRATVHRQPQPYDPKLEDDANISRVTYRFYDRNMQEVNPSTRVSKVDRARRATRSFENGLDSYGWSPSPRYVEEERHVYESRVS